jgi:hypothetical protein
VRQQSLTKTNSVIATKPGECLFVDSAGPYTTTLKGNRYLEAMVDDFSGIGFTGFAARKNKMVSFVEDKIVQLEAKGMIVKNLHCDNAAGENVVPLQKISDQKGIQLELTAPDTPQHNGIVEMRIALIIQRGNAMMIQAGLNEETKAILWPEAVDCANGVENITSTTKSSVPAHTRFTGEVSKLYPNVIKFGRVVYVTTKRRKFKGKWKERATNKSIMIGYAKNHAADTNHLMYNPKNRTVIETRDLCGDPKKI